MIKTNRVEQEILPVILAGGSGTRLWPLSRKHYAKQYLAIGSDNTMLQETLLRLTGMAHLPPILICNEETRFLAAEQVRQIDLENTLIMLEPVGRNTAPALALAALEAVCNGKDPILLAMPADHKIADTTAFHAAVSQAAKLAADGHLVTFGIKPDAPETGYGYIRAGADIAGSGAKHVDRFVEKPDLQTAKRFLDQGGYYWNSGIFMFRASRYLAELESFRPDILRACQDAFAGRKIDLDFVRYSKQAFLDCPAESIDYAVMEHTESSAVVPFDAGWSDIGSWTALWENSPKDADGNCIIGDVLNENGSGNYINSGHRLVAAVGVKDMVIVETKDVVFIAPKSEVENIKSVVEKLKAAGREEVNYHRDVYRPWGKYDTVDMGDRYQVKRITVNPGAKLSVQKHHHRAEHWVVVKGTAKVTRGDETLLLTENQSTYIPLGEIHALENPGLVALELIEVQSGTYLGEDDIIRFEDKYGRS
ncbi:MAG: mannose-1-phosphate guanylyltransferase/mannose-6-phosphate isomerase [Rhodobacteraceae bacterium]|nr:mannose-1-phosphate guanylyltransferase/mannose-6-phosphate isomerase [Paracoccaceae bacterium]